MLSVDAKILGTYIIRVIFKESHLGIDVKYSCTLRLYIFRRKKLDLYRKHYYLEFLLLAGCI